MSYRVCVLGLSVEADPIRLIRHLQFEMTRLKSFDPLTGAYVTASTDEQAARSGLRCFVVWSVPGQQGRMSDRPRFDHFARDWNGPALHNLCIDDHQGLFVWDRFTPPDGWEGIMTDGPRLGLMRIEALPFEVAPPGEEPGLATHENAISLGARHFGFKLDYSLCVKPLYERTAWSLFDPWTKRVPLTEQALPYLEPTLDDDTFALHGL